MKTTDQRASVGRLTGFTVSNLFLGRLGVPRVVATIPGVVIRRKQKRFVLFAPDDFCELVVEGKTFLVIEPFGDSSEYCVMAEPPEESAQLAKVRDAFARHRPFLGWFCGQHHHGSVL